MIEEAIKIAKRSPMLRYQTGCVLVKNNEIISNGWSHKGTNLGSLYSMHAELHALARGRHLDLRGAEAWIATISKKSGNLTSGKPCIRCIIALKSTGIENVYFTTKNDPPIFSYLQTEWFLEEFKVYKAPNGSHKELIK